VEPAVWSEAADAPGIRDASYRVRALRPADPARRVVQCRRPRERKDDPARSWIAAAGLAARAAWVSVPGEVRDPQRLWIPVVGALRDTAPGPRWCAG